MVRRAPPPPGRHTLASIHLCLGHHQEALDRHRQARTIAGEAGLLLLEGQAQTTLATACHALGHHRQALAHAELALGLHRRTGHRLGEARSLRVLGLVLRGTDGAEAAVGCWRQALDLFTDIGSPEADGLRGMLATTQAAT